MRPEIERAVRAELGRFLIPWGAMALSVLLIAGMGVFLAGDLAAIETSGGGAADTAVAVLAACLAAAAPVIDRALHDPARFASRVRVPDPQIALRYLLGGHLIVWSLAETPAILGLVQLVLGGSLPRHLLLCGAALGDLAILMPTRRRLGVRVGAALPR